MDYRAVECLQMKWLVMSGKAPVERPVLLPLLVEETGKLLTPGDCGAGVEQEEEERNTESHVGVWLAGQVMAN